MILSKAREVLSLISEGSKRELEEGIYAKTVTIFSIGISLWHLYFLTFALGKLDVLLQRTIHLTLLLSLTFLIYSKTSKKTKRISLVDYILFLFSLSIGVFIFLNLEKIMFHHIPMVTSLTNIEIFIGALLIFLVLEATRRTCGIAMTLVAIFFLIYAYFGNYLPGILFYEGLSITNIIDILTYNSDGIFGVAVKVSSTYIILFLIFGKIFVKLGGGEFFVDFANSITGRIKGGPAMASVIGSALFGTISGSAAADTVTVGSITIPMMKKIGYEPHFAAAVQAVAATGATFTPPVMAGVLFLMSEITGIPYAEIALAAAIPAFLYYISLLSTVYLVAVKTGLKEIDKDQIPLMWNVLKEKGLFFLPLVVIVVVLMKGYTPIKAGLLAIATTILVAMIRRDTRKNLISKILSGLEDGAKGACLVAAACACAGIIMGICFQTGLGGRFGSALFSLSSGGGLLPVLIVGMLVSFILGTGLDAVASYILTVILVVPATISAGVPIMAAHLFVVYMAMMSYITPPVAIAAFVAGGIAEASQNKVAFTAMRLGIIGFLVPFFFCYNPELLLIGKPINILLAAISALIGVIALSAGLEGWLFKKLNIILRIFLITGAVMMIYPGLLTDIVGICLIILVGVWQIKEIKQFNEGG
ncbi:MAG: TRAP transporter fused permease subunit [Syntrophales bacterium]|nr:TRAP transporter fused permease subunit [Syntrophales bacterium]